MKNYILALLIALALLSGCATNDQGNTPGDAPPLPAHQDQQPSEVPSDISDMQPQGFLFEAYGQDIYVCAEAAPILDAMPDPKDIFEAPSCAFDTDGMDTTYFYPGFELTAYHPAKGQTWVYSVVLTDDSVTTPEGVYLGGTLENVKKAYGGDFAQNGGQVIYSRGKGSLVFTLEDEVITGIVYTYKIEE